MQPEAFNRLVRKIRNAYGLIMYRKKANEDYGEVETFFYEEVGFKIPTEASEWIMESVLKDNDKFPNKLHSTLSIHLSKWYKAHPNKQEQKDFRCRQKECREGLLSVVKEHAVYCFRCGECHSRDDFPNIPMRTLHELELEGYKSDSAEEVKKRSAIFTESKWKHGVVRRVGDLFRDVPDFYELTKHDRKVKVREP